MPDMTDHDLEALSARLTDPTTPFPAPSNVTSGDAAAVAGHEFMVAEYGGQEALDTALRTAGRPRLGEKPRGASPSVRGRIPQADRAALDRLIMVTGKKESELVREAVHLLIERHGLAS